jgi:hypothetical protein
VRRSICGLQLGDLLVVLAAGRVLRFLHAVEAGAQLGGAFLGALERLVVGDRALGQLVGAFDGGGAGGVDAGVALTQALGLVLERADTRPGRVPGRR